MDSQPPLVKRLRLLVFPLRVEVGRNIVIAEGGLGMVFAEKAAFDL